MPPWYGPGSTLTGASQKGSDPWMASNKDQQLVGPEGFEPPTKGL